MLNLISVEYLLMSTALWAGPTLGFNSYCLKSDVSKPPTPLCNVSLSYEARARYIIGELTVEEKAKLMTNNAHAIHEKNLEFYQWWQEGLHGVAHSPGTAFQGETAATMFPQVETTSRSFNRSLFRMIGNAVGTEARAFVNLGLSSGGTYWTPNVNIFRDPRWGRGQETPGEDPKLNGDYAEDFVKAFQFDPRDSGRLKASACCKHYAAYSIETGRQGFNAEVSTRDMHESFLPAFERCVTRGNVSCLMCSYNAINGVPSCANGELMKKLAKDTWGFNGYITTDCGAGEDLYKRYHYRNQTAGKIAGDALDAGVDVTCDDFFLTNIAQGVKKGDIEESQVDAALMNLFMTQLRLGFFDPETIQPLRKIGRKDILSPLHRQLALEAARQGMTLLKNEDNHLPFSLEALNKKIGAKVAVIGPFANDVDAARGNYYGEPPSIVTVYEGVKMLFPNSEYHQGAYIQATAEHAGYVPHYAKRQAIAAAKSADHSILVLGINQSFEAEGKDRSTLMLGAEQRSLIEECAKAAKSSGKRISLVVIAGGQLDLTDLVKDSRIGSILWAGYAGQSAGTAIAETLFGLNNPSGRLTQTFYPESYIKKVKLQNMNMHPDKKTGFPGRTHRFYVGETLFPFGYGLSYTRFSLNVVDTGVGFGIHRIALTVTNIGQLSGENVALAFLVPPESTKIQQLNGDLIQKLHSYHRTKNLEPGESQMFTIQVVIESDLTVYASENDSKPTLISPTYSNTADAWHIKVSGGEVDVTVPVGVNSRIQAPMGSEV
mmetsp:Transcript_2385/g.3460  ORF Transcript_2385/g.3460 Transcript_2385/m.3460 type:complete len:774 (+) Transcript_2385:147-2468(+)